MEIELEKTYLLKQKPKDLESFPNYEILDIYFPENIIHPHLRLRKNGDNKFYITKKSPIKDTASEQEEHTIILTKEEFEALAKTGGKRLRKIRYNYSTQGVNAKSVEIDIFLDDLDGLCVVDFEFDSTEQKNNFVPPDYCGKDITEDDNLAGGILAGKKFEDIKKFLK